MSYATPSLRVGVFHLGFGLPITLSHHQVELEITACGLPLPLVSFFFDLNLFLFLQTSPSFGGLFLSSPLLSCFSLTHSPSPPQAVFLQQLTCLPPSQAAFSNNSLTSCHSKLSSFNNSFALATMTPSPEEIRQLKRLALPNAQPLIKANQPRPKADPISKHRTMVWGHTAEVLVFPPPAGPHAAPALRAYETVSVRTF